MNVSPRYDRRFPDNTLEGSGDAHVRRFEIRRRRFLLLKRCFVFQGDKLASGDPRYASRIARRILREAIRNFLQDFRIGANGREYADLDLPRYLHDGLVTGRWHIDLFSFLSYHAIHQGNFTVSWFQPILNHGIAQFRLPSAILF